ncbi:hypothetical protein GCM10028808_60780 [Spirosoma migulaei]
MDRLSLSEDRWRGINEQFALHDFLLVKAPDIVGFFYHDIHDKPIDCNIYHPKYGYDGHVADSYQFTITSYSPTVYEDPGTRKTVWCRNFLEIVCYHGEDDTYTNKDGEVIIIAHRAFSQKRLASADNADDFKEIFERELAKKGFSDKHHESNLFKVHLSKHVQELIELHEKKTTYEEREFGWIDLGKKFQDYLNSGSLKKKDRLRVKTDLFVNEQNTEPLSYFSKIKLIEQELVKPRNEELNRQKQIFEVNFKRLLSPEQEAIPFIREEYQRASAQLKECKNWLEVETNSVVVIAGYVLSCDTDYTCSFEDFWQAIWPHFDDCQRAYQLIDYLKWLKVRLKGYENFEHIPLVPAESQSNKNKFNEMPIEEVRKYFIPLAKKKSLNNSEAFLTEDQVDLFIDKAFCKNENIGILTANLSDGDMEIMGALFYNYYRKCINLGFAPTRGKQKEYTLLLTDNFSNYAHLKDSLPTNFNKYENRSKTWSSTN